MGFYQALYVSYIAYFSLVSMYSGKTWTSLVTSLTTSIWYVLLWRHFLSHKNNISALKKTLKTKQDLDIHTSFYPDKL